MGPYFGGISMNTRHAASLVVMTIFALIMALPLAARAEEFPYTKKFGLEVLHPCGSTTVIMVNDVKPGSPADKKGFRVYDLIYAVNGDPVNSPQTLEQALTKHSNAKNPTYEVFGNGRKILLPQDKASR